MKRPQAVVPGVVAIDRLEVGPPRLEPRRITAPYTVWRDGESDSVELSYRFEEDVFDDGPVSLNLASMMLAQVALNYGLFCERIVFKGSFDRHDHRFIEKFAENTAREIYVNKLLMPNEFLTKELERPTPEKRESYLHASLEFEPQEVERPPDPAWSADPSKHAVLSSGGKDSLLSFGVLRELGLGVDPIFVNESGRHWYTALNAYRHLQNTHEGTARVWTNCDRVFAWMLRHLPFIRQDFSRVRSDEYPIRLWTVAVFLFGALPLLRKRGIGRLLIGDEHDTTARVTHEGIPHYKGLYDQSRFFDEEMTRYFHRKGWEVRQFSILRQMSEMLIQKVLAHRYPELLRLQVSCHASHIEDGHALPCGNCEKCRRIVGMLLALDADPADCGYKPQQVAHCLKELAAKGVHQEAVCEGQLAQMLVERELLPETTDRFRPKPSREGLALRFHPVRSPIDTFPEDLRAGIFTTFLNHTEGALLRDGRSWKPFEPLG